MAGLNKVTLIGFCGKDAKVARTKSDQAVMNVSLAVTEKWVDANKERKERTEWFQLCMFGKRAEAVAEYVTKGKQLYVEGRLQTRKYDDKDGVTRYSTEVIVTDLQLLGGGGEKSGGGRQDEDHGSSGGYDNSDPGPSSDDIPFIVNEVATSLGVIGERWNRANDRLI